MPSPPLLPPGVSAKGERGKRGHFRDQRVRNIPMVHTAIERVERSPKDIIVCFQ